MTSSFPKCRAETQNKLITKYRLRDGASFKNKIQQSNVTAWLSKAMWQTKQNMATE